MEKEKITQNFRVMLTTQQHATAKKEKKVITNTNFKKSFILKFFPRYILLLPLDYHII